MGSGCRSPARDERAVLPSLPGLCCVRGGLPSLERLGWCRGLRARARRALRMGAPSQVTAGSCHHACRPKPSCSASCNICRPGAFSACVTTAGPGRPATVAPGAPSPAGATPPGPGADPPRAAAMSALPVPDGPDRPPGPPPTPMSLSPTAARTINASATAPRACRCVVGPRRRSGFSVRFGPGAARPGWRKGGLRAWATRTGARASRGESRPRAVGAN
jgi:hypothetical protein